MDIPVPAKIAEDQKIPVAVSTASSKSTQVNSPAPTELVQQRDTKQASKDDTDIQDEARRKVAEMITSKTYFLPIKETHTHPLITLSLFPKKPKKTKKMHVKTSESIAAPRQKGHQTLLVILLVAVLLVTLVAIDAGVIDVGVKLPFDLIKNVQV